MRSRCVLPHSRHLIRNLNNEQSVTPQYSTRHALTGWIGSAVLALGGLLHLAFGYPALMKAVAPAHLPEEAGIRAVWIALGISFVFFGAIGFIQMRSITPCRNTLLLIAGAALSNCLVLLFLVRQPTHPAVIIFGLGGILLLFSALRTPSRPTS